MDTRIVLTGGGFSSDPDSPLDDYVLGLAGGPEAHVCFLPTASGDADDYIERFHTALDRRCRTSVLRLFDRDDTDPRSALLTSDVIYVGGGNTANMLAVWRVHGVDRLLAEAYRAGVLLCGISAGMLCWFESCLTDSFGPVRPLADGLGLLPGSACPHYDSEPQRRPRYHQAITSGALPSGWALDDGAAALLVNGELAEAVAVRRDAHLYAVGLGRDGRSVVETPVPTRLIVD
ncbi:MAG TPA: peptidase E [Pseudonocardia sp.]|jgi:peptidase E